MRNSFFILCILFGLLHAMGAVPDDIVGKIVDADNGEHVVGAVVKAKGSFTSSDAEGIFRLKLKGTADSISFRCMGYEALTLPATADFSQVRMYPKATQLRDVIVQAPDIYAKGDTLVFNVSRYAKPEDNAIIDVIKRLPGVKVEDDGTIKYQGKPINKFYLDGNDFIGGQYGLATNNISHKDVASVEVMENHQPVKALEGIEFPEEAGINLKLKDDARSRWVGVAQVAGGMQPFLWDASLFTMRLGPKMQNMFTVKADNTGWNPATQISDHDLDIMFSSGYSGSQWPEYISADMVNAPLSEKRTRDNLSWIANEISAWKRGDTSMRMTMNYMGDRLDYNNSISTDYFSGSIPQFIQNNSLHTQNHDLSAQFNAEVNKRGYYFKDKLTANAMWDNSNSAITGSYVLDQMISRRKLYLGNDLKLVKRNDKKLFTIISRNEFYHNPNTLTVVDWGNACQRIGITDFRSTTESEYGRMRRFWKYYITVGADLNYHRMNTTLSGMGEYDTSAICNAFLSNLYATPQVDYERNGWRLSLKMPLRWVHHSLRVDHDYMNVSPLFYARHQLTAKSELSANVYYQLGSPSAYMNIETPVLSDYRNLFIASNPGKYSQDISTSMSYKFRNPLAALFINASVSYSHRRSEIMSDQRFIGDFIISTYAQQLSYSDTWKVNSGISKGFAHSRFVIGMDASASQTSAESMRDGSVIPYSQLTVTAKPYFRGSATKWLSLNYEANYGYSRMKINEDVNNYNTLSQNIAVTIIPYDRVTITIGAEHYLTRFPDCNSANMVLLDASAAWRINNRLRLSLTANNLLNKRRYEYITYGTLSRSEHSFQLRSRSILASLQCNF